MIKGNPEVVKALELAEGERIYGPIVLGYPKTNPSERQANILADLKSIQSAISENMGYGTGRRKIVDSSRAKGL